MGREAVKTRVERLHLRRVQEAMPERLYTQREVDALLEPYKRMQRNALVIADALDEAADRMRIKLFAELAALLRECASILRR